MKHIKFSFLILTAMMLLCHNTFASPDTYSSLKNQKLELSLSLAKDTFRKTEDNFIVSPFSLYIMADMLANGAQGETLQRLKEKILDKTAILSLEDINEEISSEIKNLSSNIEINNSIWGNFKSEYVEIMKSSPAEIFNLPNHTNIINEWIENKTHGMIKDLLEPQFTSSERNELFLVNTIYFNGKWKKYFDKKNTKKKIFHSLHKSFFPKFVNMMYQENEDIDYYENSKFQAIRLPYKKGDYIEIILPKKNIDFKKFINNLTVDDLDFTYITREVHISLPRFETEYKVKLNNYFEELQIPIFEGEKGKDFSIMCDWPCHVAKIVQQTKIQLDEEGTIAVSATAADMMQDCFDEPEALGPKIFNADHPFIYIINDGLFIGAYTKGELVE